MQLLRAKAFKTTTPLGSGGTYTSDAIQGLNYRRLTGFVSSDQGGTLDLEHSDDGTNWYKITSIAVTGGTPKGFEEVFYAQHVRAKYTNGATPQTSFELVGYLSPV